MFLSPQLSAQTTGSLRGFVADSTNGEVIIYANVALKGTTLGAPTNTRGYYYIPSIPEGEYTIIFSYLGYATKQITAMIAGDKITEIDVLLSPSSVELDELSIIADKTVRQNETDLGLQKITAKEIEYLPAVGEPDIFRVLQSSPGVSMTGDVTSKYYVRGGGDQNEVLLNGVTIYNPFHALGIFSVIDPEMISSLEFYKGGFEPYYGGRLSSILNVITKDGNKNKFQFTGQASLIAARAAVEGPIPNGSFLITGRKSYYTNIYQNYLSTSQAPFDFYDLSFKLNYANPIIDKGGKFVLHGFYSHDMIDNQDPFREDYYVNNLLAGLNWRKVWSSPLFSVFNVSYSKFEAEVLPNYSESPPRKNILSDFSTQFNFTYIYDSRDELGFGVQSTILSTELMMKNLTGQTTNFVQSGWDLSFYFNYKFFRWDRIGLDLGVRGKLLGLADKRPFIFEPRLSFTYLPSPIFALRFSVGRYSQEIVTLSDENELISIFEPWIIVPDYLNAPQATHVILGVKTFISENFSIETEAYYKDLTNLIDINQQKYNADFFDYINVDGEAYGVELLLKYEDQFLFFKTGYTLSWAYKINDGVKYYPRYDRRHSLNVLTGINLGRGWNTSVTWTFATGMPFTPIAGYYDRLQNEENPIWAFWKNYVPSTYWDARNTGRLPVYHRLDLSMSKEFQIDLADITLGASIINVYDRENIFYFDRKTGERVNMLPFMPSVFVKVKI